MVSERAKMCICANSTGKLMNDIADIRRQVNSIKFESIPNIEFSNIKRNLTLLEDRIRKVGNACYLDVSHQSDVANEVSKEMSFIIKKTDKYEFEIEKSMMLHNLGVIRDHIIKKLDDCSID